ncbi:MAG TPA: methylated-DNA--[protein]-cysteine S-methyltransferase [bacterium]|nr:methylated-DNA--[protein]-cysteine S-methyltransferase [bacterium]
METAYASSFEAPFGTLSMGATRRGICAISINDREGLYRWLFRHLDTREVIERPYYVIKEAEVELRRYLRGKLEQFSVPLDLRGTDFQKQVWQQLLRIPYGEMFSYEQVAEKIGRGRAARAVGAACGANPIPIMVPCHRVVGSHHHLGGYSGGLAVKEWLLRRERAILI